MDRRTPWLPCCLISIPARIMVRCRRRIIFVTAVFGSSQCYHRARQTRSTSARGSFFITGRHESISGIGQGSLHYILFTVEALLMPPFIGGRWQSVGQSLPWTPRLLAAAPSPHRSGFPWYRYRLRWWVPFTLDVFTPHTRCSRPVDGAVFVLRLPSSMSISLTLVNSRFCRCCYPRREICTVRGRRHHDRLYQQYYKITVQADIASGGQLRVALPSLSAVNQLRLKTPMLPCSWV